MSNTDNEPLTPAVDLEYNDNVVRLFRAPRHAGSLPPGDRVLEAAAGARAQGASVRLWLELTAEQRVKTARFQAYGCPHFIAATESLCAWAEGRTLNELNEWNWPELASSLDIPAGKRARLLVLEDAVRRAAGVSRQNR